MDYLKKNSIYTEKNHKIKSKLIDNETYSLASQSMIIVCTDAIIVDRKNKLFYLAKRSVQPMKGYWSIGGRRRAGETSQQAIQRNFHRETSLKLPLKRFKLLAVRECIWSTRKEHPINVGKHDIIFFHVVELNKKELAKANTYLCSSEYETRSLESFNYKKMLEKKIHPALVDNYKLFFRS